MERLLRIGDAGYGKQWELSSVTDVRLAQVPAEQKAGGSTNST